MRVAIYGRVSTGHQVEHQTIEQRLERFTAAVRARAAEGWTLDPGHVFRDDGYSGAVSLPRLGGSPALCVDRDGALVLGVAGGTP
jgi:DNA invertase Pin-like site-specific DNA recombinase